MKDGEMLAFYRNHNIAPVRQNISDLSAHFSRRATLYRQLGIPAAHFANKRILEIGPGTGQNALFIAAQNPGEMTLLEPNPAGRAAIESNFAPFPAWRGKITVKSATVEEFRNTDGFDFVICEGLVGASGHPDPKLLISSIASHVKPGGVLILTATDSVGFFSESLRRLLGLELAGAVADMRERIALLSEAFAPHLHSLDGMSRRLDDWVVDNLINPSPAANFVSFAYCVSALSDTFDLTATSPRFIADWTWYKRAALENNFFNRTAMDAYWRNLHNFMDYRYQSPERSIADNQRLMNTCSSIHRRIHEYEQTGLTVGRNDILKELRSLRSELSSYLPSVGEALSEVCSWLAAPVIDSASIAENKTFGEWFGHGQIYLSLARRE